MLSEFFLEPERWWHLVWVLPLIWGLQYYAFFRRKRALRAILGHHHNVQFREHMSINVSPFRRALRCFILVLIAILCVGAYARPAWGNNLISVTGAGRDIMILLDVSKSMLASDLPPSRLAHAKLLVEEVCKRLSGDRFGLISFAGNAFMECPLTSDRVSFMQILEHVDEKSIPVGGTNLQRALEVALKRFDSSETDNRAIWMITDGEELTGEMKQVLSSLRAKKIPVVIAGLGDPAIGSAIQITNERGEKRFHTDAQGNMVKTKLNETGLMALAAETKGVYVRSTLQDMGEKTIVNRLKDLTPNAHDTVNRKLPVERWIWFVAPALALLLLLLALHERKEKDDYKKIYSQTLGSLGMWGWVGGALVLMYATSASAQDSDSSFQEFNPIRLYNIGVDSQLNHFADSALDRYMEALSKPNLTSQLRARANNNIGVIQHARALEHMAEGVAFSRDAMNMESLDSSITLLDQSADKLKESADYYRESLKMDPAMDIQNQLLNLNDRKKARELKRNVEQLKKELEKLQQEAQKAQSSQSQQKQNPNTQNQKSAESQSQSAQQQAQKAAQQSGQMQNQQMKNALEKIQQEFQKMNDAQKQNNSSKADQHMQNAMQMLNQINPPKQDGDGKKQDSKSKNDKSKQSQDAKDSKEKGSKPDDKKSKPQELPVAETKNKDENMNEKAGNILLREMQAEEEEHAREILKKRFENQNDKVEKDW